MKKLPFKKPKPPVRQAAVNPAANQAFSYYRSSRSNEPRFEARSRQGLNWRLKGSLQGKGRGLLRFLPEFIAVSIVIVSVVNIMLLSPHVRVVVASNQNVSTYRPAADYITVAEEALQGSFRSRVKFLVQPEKVKQAMMSAFPEIESLEVSIPALGQKPVLYMSFYTPVAVISSGSSKFLLGENGRVIKAAVSPSDEANLIPVLDQSSIPLANGGVLMSSSQMKVFKSIYNQLRATNLQIETFILPKVPYEVDVRLTGKAYFIKFNLQGEGAAQVGALNAVMPKLESDTPKEYVDVRVEDRVYYK